MNDAPAAQVVELFADVDDLIRRVADCENPEIRKVRAKVYAALEAAKSSFDGRANQVRRHAPPMAPLWPPALPRWLSIVPTSISMVSASIQRSIQAPLWELRCWWASAWASSSH